MVNKERLVELVRETEDGRIRGRAAEVWVKMVAEGSDRFCSIWAELSDDEQATIRQMFDLGFSLGWVVALKAVVE